MAPGDCLRFGRGHLLEGSTDVERAGPSTGGRGPGDRFGEGPVDFANPRTVAEAPEGTAVPGGELGVRQPEERPGCQVQHDRAGGGEVGQGVDPPAAGQRSPEAFELPHHGCGDGLTAPFDHRPADRVRGRGEEEPERAGQRLGERRHRVRGDPGEEGSGVGSGEAARQSRSGKKARAAESDHGHGMLGDAAERGEHGVTDGPHVPYQRRHEATISGSVVSQRSGRIGHGSSRDNRSATVQWVRKGKIRLAQGPVQGIEYWLAEERRRKDQRMHGRADVMPETGQRRCLGATASAGDVCTFEHRHRETGLGQGHRGGQAIGPRAHHDDVDLAHQPRRGSSLVVMAAVIPPGLAQCQSPTGSTPSTPGAEQWGTVPCLMGLWRKKRESTRQSTDLLRAISYGHCRARRTTEERGSYRQRPCRPGFSRCMTRRRPPRRH